MSKIAVFYICDRKACIECSSGCSHTSDISHAKNFKKETTQVKDRGKVKNLNLGYFEKEEDNE